ncbi:hypothetical protein J3D56_001924 [Erwinia persicina]|jgi:hypothetical protein|uniref:DUF29 domain-containing protein n=1 Tax=Erwinia persicina TaxID=55211 RepID=UPI00209EBEAB|nr:DUF29 domain-containing protein [Erwinia persicina]MCP1438488.1 hypothetical protein [Erwinia persicina]
MASQYENDFYGWTLEQAELLQAGNLAQLDKGNLLEEIRSMGNSERRELESRLEVLLMHLLKWQYQPTYRGRSWQLTIAEQRRKIGRRLDRNPSLKSELPELMRDAYGDAILSAARETGLEADAFPQILPWGWEQLMDDNFLPSYK